MEMKENIQIVKSNNMDKKTRDVKSQKVADSKGIKQISMKAKKTQNTELFKNHNSECYKNYSSESTNLYHKVQFKIGNCTNSRKVKNRSTDVTSMEHLICVRREPSSVSARGSVTNQRSVM